MYLSKILDHALESIFLLPVISTTPEANARKAADSERGAGVFPTSYLSPKPSVLPSAGTIASASLIIGGGRV